MKCSHLQRDMGWACFMYFLSWSICSKDYTNIKVIKSLRYKTFTRRQLLYIDWYTDDLKFYLYYNSLIHGQADLLMSPVRLWKIETSGLTVIKRLSTISVLDVSYSHKHSIRTCCIQHINCSDWRFLGTSTQNRFRSFITAKPVQHCIVFS